MFGMRWHRWAVLAAAAAFLLAAKPVSALEPVAWQTDFAAAQQLARKTNRLLLLHFWLPNCAPCHAVETQVFNQPGFAQALSVHYVPVKINGAEHPELARTYQVTQYPTEVVVALDGRAISRFRAPRTAASYLATATQIARANPPTVEPFAQAAAVAPSLAAVQPPTVPAAPTAPPPQTAQSVSALPQPAAAPVAPPPAPPTQNPPLGLDGYCPVRLCENHAWVKGNPQYGVSHRGRLYLFAGAAEQQKFWQNPDRYSPVRSGEDPVVAVDQGLRVAGKREFGMFYGPHVYLFSSEESYQRFEKNPRRYIGEELQAQRPASSYR